MTGAAASVPALPAADFSVRSQAAELMDAAGLSPDQYDACMRDLAKVNTLFLAQRPTLRWLDRATRTLPPGEPVSVFDVAFGGGDMLRAIADWGRRRGRPVVLGGVDLNPDAARLARAASPGLELRLQTGDVLQTEPDVPPDYITCSLFTHHLSNGEVVAFLRWMERHARRGWFVNDVHRHPLCYYGFRVTGRLAGWHPIVRHDGAVSITRSFVRRDWLSLIAEAAVPARVRWQVPFRLCVERLR